MVVEAQASRQIDVLVNDKNWPTLFKEEGLVIVEADAAAAIIEVKTSVRKSSDEKGLRAILGALAGQVANIRRAALHGRCWAGLFAYDESGIHEDYLLESLQTVTEGDEAAAIDCVALGPDLLACYCEDGPGPEAGEVPGPLWIACRPEELAQPYFISSLIFCLSPRGPAEGRFAWVTMDHLREKRRLPYIPLSGGKVRALL
jgi:hypothetical protein